MNGIGSNGSPAGPPPGSNLNSCDRAKTRFEYFKCIMKAAKTDPVVRRKVIMRSGLPVAGGLLLIFLGIRSKKYKGAKVVGGAALVAYGIEPWINPD